MDPLERVAQLELELAAARNEIASLRRDCVSGLLGRRPFEQHLEGTFRRNRCTDRPFGIIMIDIDHFKQVNDQHGHRVGDEVINRVATSIQACTRVSDIAARYGGEEFVCMLVNAEGVGVALMSERIRRVVESMRVPGLPPVTVSVGFALQRPEDLSPWDVITRADFALYKAKQRGRNRVEGETFSHEEVKLLTEIERRCS